MVWPQCWLPAIGDVGLSVEGLEGSFWEDNVVGLCVCFAQTASFSRHVQILTLIVHVP